MWNIDNKKSKYYQTTQKLKKIFEKDCNQNINIENMEIGCYNLGVMYFDGKGVKKDIKKAKQLFKKSCNNEHYDDACNVYKTIN